MTPDQIKFLAMLKQSAKLNLSVGQERRQRVKSEINQEKGQFREKFKKVETEMSEEKTKEMRDRDERKRRLAISYEEQMGSASSMKYLEKMENHRFQQVAYELEQKKERERANVSIH